MSAFPLVIASDFGSIAAAELVVQAFAIGLVISLLSLACALPKKIRQKGRWHAWTALSLSVLACGLAGYFMSLVRKEWNWTDIFLVALLAAPIGFSLIAVRLTRPKKNEL